MKTYKVTLQLITGYYDEEYENPKLRDVEFVVEAETEREAVNKAKELDKTYLSIWDHYAEEV